jgi:hypothetical protein
MTGIVEGGENCRCLDSPFDCAQGSVEMTIFGIVQVLDLRIETFAPILRLALRALLRMTSIVKGEKTAGPSTARSALRSR